MFDSIGVNPDREANKRRAGAALLTVCVTGAVGAALAIATWCAVGEIVGPVVAEPPMVFLEPDNSEVEPLFAPPPPAISRGVRSEATTAATPVTDVPTAIVPLAAPPPDKLAEAGGDPNGKEEGRPDGVIDGKGAQIADKYCQGDACGGTSDGGGGVRVFHHTDLELRRQPPPSYPAEAEALGLGETRCVATVRIDAGGVPYSVVVSGCPDAFHAETVASLMKWRWYPPRAGKIATRAQTQIAVTYKLR